MSSGDIALNIAINGTNNVGGVIDQIAKGLSGLAGGGVMGAVAVAGVAAAAAIVGIGVASTKMAGNFQEGLTTLVTGAGEAESNLKMVGDGILKVSADTGTSTDSLVKAMYLIESSGQHGADGLKVLTVAAQGAKVGNADLATTAGALTTILTDYHMPTEKAASAMNGLTATVAAGKTNLQDLGKAMGSVLPLASSLGIAFPQVGGAIAVMTNSGMSAQRASQNLANALRSLAAPGASATKAMTEVGLSADDVHTTLTQKGLTEALQLIEDHVGKKFPEGSVQWVSAMKAIMGGATGLNVAMMLGGQNMATFEANVTSISGAMQKGGSSVTGWALVQQDLNMQWSRAVAALQAFMIVLGEKLLPLVTPVIKAFADFIGVITGWMSGVAQASQGVDPLIGVIQKLGLSFKDAQKLAGDLRNEFNAVMQFLQSTFAPVWGAVTKAVNDVKNAWSNMIKAFKEDSQLWGMIAKEVGGGLLMALAALAKLLAGALVDAIQVVSKVITSFIGVFEQIGKHAIELQSAMGDIADFLKETFVPVWKVLQDSFKQIGAAWSELMKSFADAAPEYKFLAEIIGTVLVVAIKVLAYLLSAFLVGAIAIVTYAIKAVMGVFEAFNKMLKTVGDVVKWLGDTWSAFAKWFVDTTNAIRDKAKSAWDSTTQNIQKSNQSISDWLKGAWANIVSFMQASAQKIGDSFKWLYDHNYYFKDLCDFVTKTFQQFFSWASAQWTAFTKWLADTWKQVSKWADDTWATVSQTVAKWTQQSGDAIKSIWQSIIQWLQETWKGITKLAEQLWQSISQVFSQAWQNYIAGPLAQLWQNISQWFNGIMSDMEKFGENIINSIAKGISNGTSTLIKGLKDAMSSALSALGFHNIPGFAGGVTNFAGGWAVVGEKGPELMFLPTGASIIPSGSPPPMASSTGGGNTGGDQPMQIIVMLDGKTIGKVVTKYQARELRVQGIVRSA